MLDLYLRFDFGDSYTQGRSVIELIECFTCFSFTRVLAIADFLRYFYLVRNL
ncbi:hypothetical protein Q648_00095 [Bartonella quintana JK 12]|uniref:Uncharacterized protein n=2 Tax=Bartonella quintana TaxID=803 RepID=W3TVW4_BARQI|nr:hypothetical protein Q651_00409 [Bartonella quintana BQ2-D70]ETS13888.1 hypothetical protein Q650_00504 [Bartonella quintana JK 73rel]ETS15575.1 hypothetical protein Q649_00513 [Bartonella quintana JK 73]ETS17581.1 hypothetical protein Q647_00505 [Bartonella quintana JK 7]ETS18411.1 hypothetical protein Q648_00095 [Bartonella quintana JK 12]KEC59407.1 hypothetical protein O93_00738 [Bartonella quintana JK 19]KEC62485.1 hypothetical protein O7Y_00522 [Bartonella quintana JK 63]KEC63657.1 h